MTYLHRLLTKAASSVLGLVVIQGLYFRDVGQEAPPENYISQEAVRALLPLRQPRAPFFPAPPSLGCTSHAFLLVRAGRSSVGSADSN